jgi:hypothetical protein
VGCIVSQQCGEHFKDGRRWCQDPQPCAKLPKSGLCPFRSSPHSRWPSSTASSFDGILHDFQNLIRNLISFAGDHAWPTGQGRRRPGGFGCLAEFVTDPIVAFPKATTKRSHLDLAHHNGRLTASTEDPKRLTYGYESAVW